jgi:hypothetical protein
MSPDHLDRMADSVAPGCGETRDIDIDLMPSTASPLNDSGGFTRMTSFFGSRTFGFVLTAAIIGLTLTTANIHLGLGGVLFTLNGLGYLGLAGLLLIGAAAPMTIVQRFSWFPRLAVVGYAAMTITGYLVMGPYFTLGFITKGIEAVLIALVVVDILRVYGSPMGFVRTALSSVGPILPARIRALAA